MHAWGQVASYPHEAVDPRRLNALLPPDVAVLAATPVADGFDARGDAVSRTYCYRVLNRARPLGARRASARCGGRGRSTATRCDACAAALPGAHDFTAFTPDGGGHKRSTRDVTTAEWRSRRRPARVLDHRATRSCAT